MGPFFQFLFGGFIGFIMTYFCLSKIQGDTNVQGPWNLLFVVLVIGGSFLGAIVALCLYLFQNFAV